MNDLVSLPAVALSAPEQSKLAELEQIVAAGLQTFVDVGLALRAIRDERLYRDAHDTFEAYLDDRWHMSRSRGYRLIDGARVAELVSPIGDIRNEAQARELVPLLDNPQSLVDVARELEVEFGERVTARDIRNVVAKRVARREREQTLYAQRAEAERAAQAEVEHDPDRVEIAVADVRTWRPSHPVAAIITDPPYLGADVVELHQALRDFALDVLPDGAPLVVMTWQPIAFDVHRALEHPELVFRWPIEWRYGTSECTFDHRRRVFPRSKPVLVYHRGGMPSNAQAIRGAIVSEEADKLSHEWGQSLPGFDTLVEWFSLPGETVCDPFVGGGTTAVAALARGRCFSGCDVDAAAVATTKRRIAA